MPAQPGGHAGDAGAGKSYKNALRGPPGHETMTLALAPHAMALPLTSPCDARTLALEATSADPWGPSRALMDDLCAHARTPRCADVLPVLLAALTAPAAHWRRVLKALTTLAHCLPAPAVARFARAHRALILRLAAFEHVDAYRLDRGAAVRDEAHRVARLLRLQPAPPPAQPPAPPCDAPARTPLFPPFAPSHTAVIAALGHPPAAVAPPPTITAPPDADTDDADTDGLAALLALPPDEDTWLNIYKRLFLLQNGLPTAPDATIAHWARHVHLIRRVRAHNPHPSPHPSPHAESIAPDVRRLAAELARIFDDARRPADVRRRAAMF